MTVVGLHIHVQRSKAELATGSNHGRSSAEAQAFALRRQALGPRCTAGALPTALFRVAFTETCEATDGQGGSHVWVHGGTLILGLGLCRG